VKLASDSSHKTLTLFDVPQEDAMTSYVISSENEAAYAWLTQWPFQANQIRTTFLKGCEKSGKTHLSFIWQQFCATQGKTVAMIDSVEKMKGFLNHPQDIFYILKYESIAGWTEEDLFHFYNATRQTYSLWLSRHDIDHFQLKDLVSRLKTAHVLEIHEPQEQLLFALYKKFFHAYGLDVKPPIIQYLLTQGERRFDYAYYVVLYLNTQALKHHEKLTLSFVKKKLIHFHMRDQSDR